MLTKTKTYKNRLVRAKKNRSRKTLILISAAIILLLVPAAVFSYNKLRSPNPQVASDEKPARPVNTVDYSPAKPGDNALNDERKSKSTPPNQTLTTGSNNNATGAAPTVTVTRAGVVGSNLQVGTLVDGITAGTCTLTVSQSGKKSVVQSEDIELQNNSYVCPVFSIPTSKFSGTGKWNVSVAIKDDSGHTATAQWTQNPVTIN